MARSKLVGASVVVGLAALTLAASSFADQDLTRSTTVAATPTVFPADLMIEATGADEIDGEIVVDVRDDASASDIADLATKFGLTLRAASTWSAEHDKLEIADVDPAHEDEILQALANDPRVEHAERMSLLHASFVPNDPLYDAKQWHLKRVGAESAWEYTCGRGVTVAVIDTGVACFDKGPFMKGTDLQGTRCEGGYNFVDNNTDAYDDHGHGTHVAGTIAQTTNNGMGTAGLAYCATLMPVKVLSKQGYGTVAAVADGIRFAADNGAQVINMSLGGPIKSKILEDAVSHAIKKGALIVAAAGNSGRSVGWPAAYPGVVAVSATDSNDKIAWFSSRGPEVAIAAPGVGVTQQTVCNGGKDKCEIFGTFSGTSMASPHVAGVAAMIVGAGVTDIDSVRASLTSTAVAKDDAKLYGAGIVDAAKAVARAHWLHLALRLVALVALFALVASRIKRQGGEVVRTPGGLVGALFAAVGLLPFAPLLHLGTIAGPLRWVVELLQRPFGEWDILLGVGIHKWLPLASALPVVALTMLFFGVKRLRFAVGGFALGTAALLAQLALSADVAFVGGSMLLRVYAFASAAVCLWIARIGLDAKKA